MRSMVVFLLLCSCSSGKPAAQPPATPANLTAAAGDRQVTLLWDAVDSAIGYRVYSGESALTAHVDVGTVTSWTVAGLSNGQPYVFAVSALGVGGEGAQSATVSATPKANPPLAVLAVTPADATAGVPRNATVAVQFDKPAQAPTPGCGGTVQLSDDGFAHCADGSFASTDGATWTFTPSSPLHGNATYAVRVTTGQKDTHGVALGQQFQSAGFTTAPALAVTLAPSGTVAVRPQIALTFNRAVDHATVTSIESGSTCSGAVQLAAGGACVAMTHAWSGNVATFTPAAALAPSTAYVLTVSTAVKDSDGVPLDAPASGGFTTVAAASLTGSDFQHVGVAWTSASGAHVRTRVTGTSAWTESDFAAGVGSARLLLAPGKIWDVQVAPLDGAGVEQPATSLGPIATGFAGSAAEWEPGQLAKGDEGGHFRFVASDSEFFAAYSSGDDTATLDPAHADALWIGFDTDPAADATGVWTLATGGGSIIAWPFKVDAVVELKDASTMNVYSAASGWSALSGASAKIAAGIAEIRFPRAAVGVAGAYRVAFAAVATHTNVSATPAYTFDVAPAAVAPAVAFWAPGFASLTGALAPAADQATSLSAAAASAAPLVHFKVTGASSAVQLKLIDGAPLIGPATLPLAAGEGSFNFGGSTAQLGFKFTDGGADEFAAGKERFYALAGAAESLPTLAWNTAYSATHPFALSFVVSTSGSPDQVRGSAAELGAWGVGPAWNAASVSFAAQDFTAAPLQFKLHYGDGSYEGGANHTMDDDVINARTLSWNAGDGSTF